MTANKGIVFTESQKKSSCEYVKKTTVQLTVKCHIEKVGPSPCLPRELSIL